MLLRTLIDNIDSIERTIYTGPYLQHQTAISFERSLTVYQVPA